MTIMAFDPEALAEKILAYVKSTPSLWSIGDEKIIYQEIEKLIREEFYKNFSGEHKPPREKGHYDYKKNSQRATERMRGN